jgi:hypothetical protein
LKLYPNLRLYIKEVIFKTCMQANYTTRNKHVLREHWDKEKTEWITEYPDEYPDE